MIRKNIEISRCKAEISTKNNQLLINNDNSLCSVPIEDIGIVLIDQPDSVISSNVFSKMSENSGAMIFCDTKHMPCGIYLPISTHTSILNRIKCQINAPEKVKYNIWQQIIVAKIKNQSYNLRHKAEIKQQLLDVAESVKLGDLDNREAVAAKLYWKNIFSVCTNVDQKFCRTPGCKNSLYPNNLLDYGYIILRTAICRQLIISGLLPTLGIKHCNVSNNFALSDDLMEPFRPFVDKIVFDLVQINEIELNQTVKSKLINVLNSPVNFNDEVGILQTVIPKYIASFIEVMEKENKELKIPTFCE